MCLLATLSPFLHDKNDRAAVTIAQQSQNIDDDYYVAATRKCASILYALLLVFDVPPFVRARARVWWEREEHSGAAASKEKERKQKCVAATEVEKWENDAFTIIIIILHTFVWAAASAVRWRVSERERESDNCRRHELQLVWERNYKILYKCMCVCVREPVVCSFSFTVLPVPREIKCVDRESRTGIGALVLKCATNKFVRFFPSKCCACAGDGWVGEW